MQNIIEARLPPLLPLLPRDLEAGVTLVVEAGWEARTARSIALTFRCATQAQAACSLGARLQAPPAAAGLLLVDWHACGRRRARRR